MSLSWEGWVTVVVMIVGLIIMATDKLAPDFVFMAMLGLLLACQIITLEEGLSGFSNSGLATVIVLFPVAEGISQTGGLDAMFAWLLGKPSTLLMAQVRMMAPVALLSAFLNNTPIVALLVPLIFGWARGSHGSIHPQKLLIPLSFSSMLGGTCTLIGTSTNLVIAGLQADRAALDPSVPVFGMFDITMYGFPYAVFGILYILFSSPALLPPVKRMSCHKPGEDEDETEELLVGLQVGKYSHVVGKTIEEAALRSLDKLFLVSVERGGYPIPAVGPDFVLAAKDVIFFSGDLKGVKDLARTHGLHYVTDENEDDVFRTRIGSPISYFGSPEKPRPRTPRSPGHVAPPIVSLETRSSIDDTFLVQASMRSRLEPNGIPEIQGASPQQERADLTARQFSLSRTSDPIAKKLDQGTSASLPPLPARTDVADSVREMGSSSPQAADRRSHPFDLAKTSVIPGLCIGVGPSTALAGTSGASPPGSPKAPNPSNLLRAKLMGSSELVSHSIRQVGFRRKMNASVVAVIREGQRVSGKIGDIVLEGGDVLLLDAGKGFDRYSDIVKSNFSSLETITEEARDFMVPMEVIDGSNLIGKTVQEAELRGLPGLFLVAIDRADGETIHAVAPDTVVTTGDVLWFSGDLESISALRKIAGLRHQDKEQADKLGIQAIHRRLVQAVVASSSPLVGQTVKKAAFRTHYGAAIVAVHRQGERLRQKIGEVTLHAGDVLLLDTGPGFVEKHQYDASFALLAEVENSNPTNKSRMMVAGAFGLAMILTQIIGVFTGEFMDLFTAALLASAGMLATGCLTGAQARKSINWDIFVTIGAAFGVSIAMENTGVAGGIASFLVQVGEAAGGQVALLVAIYIGTAFLSNIIANNAAAAIMFPISFQVAEELGIDYNLMSVTLMLGASSCYMTPFGYQTNLMVFGAGGYRTMDFVRFGGPLQLWLTGAFTIIIVLTVAGYLWILLIACLVGSVLIVAFPFILQFASRRGAQPDQRRGSAV